MLSIEWAKLRRYSTVFLAVIMVLLLPSCGGKMTEQQHESPAIREQPQIAYSIEEPAKDSADLPMMAPAPDAPAAPSNTQREAEPEQEFGNILFNPPTEMTRDRTERIEVRISRDAMDASGLQGTGGVIEDTVRVSNRMSVVLYGDKFKVVAISDELQLVEQTGYTEWSFDVTPLAAGKNQKLTLKASIHLPEGVKNRLVYSKPISIDVDPTNAVSKWLGGNWQLLTLLLFTALLVVYVVRAMRGRKRTYKLSGNEAVFISYRRDDSSGYTLAIYEQLKKALGDEAVFMDLDDIPHGVDFVEHLDKVLSKACSVLVMIGEQWLNASNAHGRRLDNPNDFVRMEIAKALQRDIRVIPVLLRNAQMPPAEALPENLQALPRRNGIRIHDDQFEASIQRLLEAIVAK